MKERVTMIERNKLIIKIDMSIYDKDAVLKTCYIFQDRCHTKVEPDTASVIKITLIPKKESSDLQLIEKQFCDELIDQQIRYENEMQFSDIRKMIVEQAFKPISYTKLKSKINK
jgi:His-Xaa-Ser system protein HxsD